MSELDLLFLLKKILSHFVNKELAIEWLKTEHPILGCSPLVALANGKKDQILYLLSFDSNLES